MRKDDLALCQYESWPLSHNVIQVKNLRLETGGVVPADVVGEVTLQARGFCDGNTMSDLLLALNI